MKRYVCSIFSCLRDHLRLTIERRQEVDQKAPEIWHKLVNHPCPDEVYDELCVTERVIVDSWKEKRQTLIQCLLRQELDAKLEEYELHSEPSLPFLRCRVRSILSVKDKMTDEDALLTVWNPTVEQTDLLHEGNAVRLSNVGVKNERFNGMIQLSAGQTTSITRIPSNQFDCAVGSCSHLMRLSAVHLISKKLSSDSARDYPSRVSDIDLCGVAVYCECHESDYSLWLIDQSYLVVKVLIKHDEPNVCHQIPASLLRGDRGVEFLVASLRNVKVLPFSSCDAGSALVEFHAHSKVAFASNETEVISLRKWVASSSGRQQLLRCSAYCHCRLGMMPSEGENIVLVAYVNTFRVLSTKQLVVFLDLPTGSQVFKFPLSLIGKVTTLCGDLHGKVVLACDDECQISRLTSPLANILRARRSPYRFSVSRMSTFLAEFPDCKMEVMDVENISTEAISEFYASLQSD